MSFELDPFQKQAIEAIEKGHSLFISAPTGAGKTLIAEYAIEKAMAAGEQIIYTAPIKALSNQKYRDFRARYSDDQVGILTGDVSIQSDAPILIMTTEIYRNSLFENPERIRKIAWVIFDEVHYLDDPERGTVWEEALLFTPQEVKILALSATVPNVREITAWIRTIHDRPIDVIEESHRPVPLHFLFQCQGRLLGSLKDLRTQGYLSRDNWRLTPRERRRGLRPMRPKANRIEPLIEHLIEQKRLPAIYFVFGRRRAESLALEAMRFDLITDAERSEITERYETLLKRYNLTAEPSARDLAKLVEQGIAFHHAGMLPTLKEVVEQLFTSRLIKLIFTTETFALGINMPARSVLFDELQKFYGYRFSKLTTRDFYQMAGRAGRRGMDKEGFVYVRVNPGDVTYPEVERILFGRPEAIESQLNTAYATLLNLYQARGRNLLEIYPRSFHHFQSSHKKREMGIGLLESKLGLLEELGYLNSSGLTPKGRFGASIFGYELMLAQMHEAGVLEGLDDTLLSILLAALVFEPRKNDHPPKLTGRVLKLQKTANDIFHAVRRAEVRYRIFQHTKPPYFHLAPAIEAWSAGESFEKTLRQTTADEGELVRMLRMVIQLLRELWNAPEVSDALKARARNAFSKINRGVVDAERQLRV